jgi:hypothetical protein
MAVMVNWGYVAGFFDGEGNINERHGTISIYQNDLHSLNAINQFCISKGIRRPYWLVKESGFRRDGAKRCNVLQYGSKKDILIFLNGVLPYLIVKRQKAEDVRRFLTLYPALTAKQASILGNESSSKKMRAAYGHTKLDKRIVSNKLCSIA